MEIDENQIRDNMERLCDWFRSFESCIVAFSSGVDSTLLAFCAKKALGNRAFAVTSISPSFSERENLSARELSKEVGIQLIFVTQNDLSIEGYVANDVNRCYFCRSNLVQAIRPIAFELSVSVCVDGTQLDDLCSPRPGVRALREAGFRAPYLELGFGKDAIRSAARLARLSNWDRPSETCLSSRVAFGQRIDSKTLRKIEAAENVVKSAINARIVRVRTIGGTARVEVEKESVRSAFEKRFEITVKLKQLGYNNVVIDPEGYVSGRMLELFADRNN